ncbi:LmeA family phospholipid-binding protein [Leucobacter soli]|uniref:DUF2993 domain-containing protein n=2 Tax=Leucobacter soli TaxID=2812850 RepID=A0A916JYH9_9MICO|nr:LmeA family phospholipid-binding protein [Leucobacter soli]CAG7616114.1 hypothetical protein LEUCIP111803_01952 [Leucobacter soli]
MPGSSRTVPDVAASADTVPLPDSIPPRDDDRPEALEPPRRRRRWLRIAVPVVVLLLVIGAAELAIRLIVPGIVSSVVRENLSLSEEHPVEVRLGAFELPSVLTGRLSTVEVEVDDAQLIDGLTGTVRLRADSVPFAVSEGEIRGASASLMIGKDELPAAIGLFTAGVADGGVVSGGELVVSREVALFGADVRLEATLGLSVADGDVVIEPRAVGAAGFDLSADRLRELTGGTFDGMLSPHDVCVADRLPTGLELTGIDLLSTGAARLTVAVAPDILSNPAQLETGSC